VALLAPARTALKFVFGPAGVPARRGQPGLILAFKTCLPTCDLVASLTAHCLSPGVMQRVIHSAAFFAGVWGSQVWSHGGRSNVSLN